MGRSGKRPMAELKPGFLAEFLIKHVDKDKQTLEVELSQVPEIQAALVCINSHNGEIVRRSADTISRRTNSTTRRRD